MKKTKKNIFSQKFTEEKVLKMLKNKNNDKISKLFSYPKVANSVESSVLGETYVWNQGSSK